MAVYRNVYAYGLNIGTNAYLTSFYDIDTPMGPTSGSTPEIGTLSTSTVATALTDGHFQYFALCANEIGYSGTFTPLTGYTITSATIYNYDDPTSSTSCTIVQKSGYQVVVCPSDWTGPFLYMRINVQPEVTTKSIDVSTLSGWSSLSTGTYNMSLVAKASGYAKSNKSSTIQMSKYSISATTTNVTASSSNPTTVVSGGSATLTFTADGTSYKMPTTITAGSTTISADTSTVVSGMGTFLYTRTSDTTGAVQISSATGNVSFTVVGEAVVTGYNVSVSSYTDIPQAHEYYGYDALYSTDNGVTWNSIRTTGLVGTFSQIKFRINIDYDPATTSYIKSTKLGLNLTCGGYTVETSSNYTLTQNIDDLVIYLSDFD